MDPLQILAQVNAFYSNAFSHLQWITIAILGFGGVFLPVLLQYLQFRSFQQERDYLKKQIKNEIQIELDSAIKELFQTERDNFQKQIEEQFKKIKTQQEEQTLAIKGIAFFLQGNFEFDKKLYSIAANDFAIASEILLRGKDELNCRRTLDLLISECFPELKKEDFEDFPDLDTSIDKLLDTLKLFDENGRYNDYIRSIFIKRKKIRGDKELVEPTKTENQ